MSCYALLVGRPVALCMHGESSAANCVLAWYTSVAMPRRVCQPLLHEQTEDSMPAQRLSPSHQAARSTVDLDAPSLYLNREISWLQFNWRVLEEALDERHPLLERVKFLAIFAKNLDEFFMVRVSGLLRQVTDGVLEVPPDGLRTSEQLTEILHTYITHLARY